MGTVNFRTSNYITIGLEPYDSDDFINDCGMVDYDRINDEYQYDRDNIDDVLEDYDFDFFDVYTDGGYYESFCLLIEHKWGDCFDWKEDREEAEKEVDRLEKCLRECIDNGLCVVHPGWCTSYLGLNESYRELGIAMEDLRKTIRETPIEWEDE